MNAWVEVVQGEGGCLWTVVEKRWVESRVRFWRSRLLQAPVHHPKQAPLSFELVRVDLPDDLSEKINLQGKKNRFTFILLLPNHEFKFNLDSL